MELMARYEDNHFELAIVDPPYGIVDKTFVNKGSKALYDMIEWDKEIPNESYFNELFRVSKNQIIWGGNYFALPHSRGWIVWDKMTFSNNHAPFELCWSSFNNVGRFFRYMNCGHLTGFENNLKHRKYDLKNKRIHPTQKPIELYEWLLIHYAKENDKILDTHLGSGSIAIACHNLGFDLTACELDTEYFNKAIERIEQHKRQQRLF